MKTSSRESNLKQLSEGAKVYDVEDDDLDSAFAEFSSQASLARIKVEPESVSPETGPTEISSTWHPSVPSDPSRSDEIRPHNSAAESHVEHDSSSTSLDDRHRTAIQGSSRNKHPSTDPAITSDSRASDGAANDCDPVHVNSATDQELEITQHDERLHRPPVADTVQTDLSDIAGTRKSKYKPPHVETFEHQESEVLHNGELHQTGDDSTSVLSNGGSSSTSADRVPTSNDNGVQPQTKTGVVNLGPSIFQRNANTQPDPAAARQTLLQQQREMAAVYKKNTLTSKRREDEQPANPDEDQTIYQGQQIGPVDHPYDIDVEFRKAQRDYVRSKTSGTGTLPSETRFLKLEMEHGKQMERLRREAEGHAVSSDDDGDDELFIKDAAPKPGQRNRGKARGKGKGNQKGNGKRRSEDSGSDQDYEERPAKRAKGQANPKATTAKPRRVAKSHAGPHTNRSFGASNVLGDAQAAEGLRKEQPGWGESDDVGKRRISALRALMRNVPAESQASARTDKTILHEALKNFTGVGAVKPAEGGKWLVSGMTTSLTPHQVIGTSFMRQRESRSEQPKGGILADQMGLGKTLMALANIINGRPNKRIVAGRHVSADQVYTTLIVVPPALVTQWQDEIKKHLRHNRRNKGWGIGSVLVYNEKSCGNLEVDDLYGYDIILTTYGEVSRSWPVIEIPALEDGDEKDQWFQEHFFDKRGLLHKATFLRVCLDEAHCIRNVDTKTSVACRNLVGEHCWAITGTPMVNGSFDLYALFEFIRHPTVKCPNGFRKKYVDPQHPMSVDKFSDDLSGCMSRFTHRDHLFGARLVNLPKARGDTLRLDFSRLESAIYEIVRNRFATRVQRLSDEGQLRSKLTHIWVLMLRLRQLTAHPLMIQGEICSCLEREDFEKLERLVERESSAHADGSNLIVSIRNVLHKERAAAERRIAEDHQDGADEQYSLNLGAAIPREHQEGDLKGYGGQHGRHMRFGKYLDAIKSSETYRRITREARCCVCQQPPNDPFITDCYHFYCKVCLEDSQFEAAENGHDRASCASCGKEMTAKPSSVTVPDDDDEGSQKPKKKKKGSGKGGDMESWLDMKGEVLPSTKTIAAKSQILNWWDPLAGGDPDVKVIIFTQWLGMVKVLSKMCETEKWGYCTLTGDFSVKKRDAQLQRFKTSPEARILISSLRCGGLGLNLTVASKVIIIDPWWNEAIEQQAFCRVFRIGQDKETSMVSLAIKNSVDDRLFELKETKKTEIDKVMLDHKLRRKVDLRGVLSVFGTVDEDENGRLFFTELNERGDLSGEDEEMR